MATAKKNGNPFDSIATKKSSDTRKTTKIAATVNDDIRLAVDNVIQVKAKIAELEASKIEAEDKIRSHVQTQQDELGYSGNYNKTFSVAGKLGEVSYVSSDKFSALKPEVQEEVQTLLGNNFDNCFTQIRTITLKPEAVENKDFIDKLMKALSAAGMDLQQAFDVSDVIKAKPDLDANVYKYVPKTKLASFRALVKQTKPSIR
jgi:hypothetical protein